MSEWDHLTKDERAAEARALQQNPVLQETLAKMEADSISAIKGSTGDTLTQGAACATLRAVDSFRAYLESIVNDAKVANSIRRKAIGE